MDLTPGMLERARKKAASLGHPVTLQMGDVQCLDYPDANFDQVTATFLFCSVPDPVKGLSELKRVVKPGGRMFLLEHVRSNQPAAGRLMDWLNPVVVRLRGANINRRTVQNVRAAGWFIEDVEELGLGIFKLITARKN
jgi:ubiquinone/menaquinone biosynthesis C-methylase UbiE